MPALRNHGNIQNPSDVPGACADLHDGTPQMGVRPVWPSLDGEEGPRPAEQAGIRMIYQLGKVLQA